MSLAILRSNRLLVPVSPDKQARNWQWPELTDGVLMDLVALVLFGDVPKWSGQGHFEDTSGTRPGHVRDMSGRGHIFKQVWESTWDKFEKGKKGHGTD